MGGAERTCLLEIGRVEPDLPQWPAEDPLDRCDVFLRAVAQRERGERIRAVDAVDAVWQRRAGECDLQRRPFDICPRVRLVGVTRVQHLVGRHGREPGWMLSSWASGLTARSGRSSAAIFSGGPLEA